MPKVIINTMEKDKGPFEIDVTEKEAAIVRSFWVAGAEVIVIGGRPWNTKYIIGVADGGNKVRSTLKIDAPKENKESIRKELDKIREFLEGKGLKKKEVPVEEEVIDKIVIKAKNSDKITSTEDINRKIELDKIPF